MATKLLKPIEREFSEVRIPDLGKDREPIVRLYPNGAIEIRLKGTRQSKATTVRQIWRDLVLRAAGLANGGNGSVRDVGDAKILTGLEAAEKLLAEVNATGTNLPDAIGRMAETVGHPILIAFQTAKTREAARSRIRRTARSRSEL